MQPCRGAAREAGGLRTAPLPCAALGRAAELRLGSAQPLRVLTHGPGASSHTQQPLALLQGWFMALAWHEASSRQHWMAV